MNNKGTGIYPIIRQRFFEKVRNSYLTPTFLWNWVVDYQKFEGAKYSRLKRGLLRLAWFWPKLSDAQTWRDGGVGKQRDPEHFSRIDQHGEILMQEILERATDHSTPILDLGCNCGRFLDFLAKRGYINLHGVDISQAALDYMQSIFPESYVAVKLTRATFQEFLQKSETFSYGAVFSRGATVELVPPTFPLIKQLCRITKEYVILMIDENGHSYPRFWEAEFEAHGFLLVKLLRPVSADGGNISLMVFQRYNGM